MQIDCTLNNCNNIDTGVISLVSATLNIKFGINGTGKSTISRAIKYHIESPERLTELTPFKQRSQDSGESPAVTLSEPIESILIFDEDYLDQFLFKEDELISNSFEIFIKTEEYTSALEQIDILISEVKSVFQDKEGLIALIDDFESLSRSFKTTQTGLSKSSSIYKGLKRGNKVENIPDSLVSYSDFIKDPSRIKWLDWQIKGEPFLSMSDSCPYCTSPVIEKRETIRSVGKIYDKAAVKNLSEIITTLDNLGDYFSPDAYRILDQLTKKDSELAKSEMDYIFSVKNQIDNLLVKLRALRVISPPMLSREDDVEDFLRDLKIDINLYDRFRSPKTSEVIESLNGSIGTVLDKIEILRAKVDKQKSIIVSLIQKHKESINAFLSNAGYRYHVEIVVGTSSVYRLMLKHNESDQTLSGVKQHLSYGEKNAFALVLFMYEALHKSPDLIVLDDPISSFDQNKKYAIMHMLFRGTECLKGRTILMLTHDLDPIIDTIKILQDFSGFTNAYFLSNRGGYLSESRIKRKDLKTFSQICSDALTSDLDELIKVIYLRRKFEIIDDRGNEYQVLSNLLHGREQKDCTDSRPEQIDCLLSSVDFDMGVSAIQNEVSSFNYAALLLRIQNVPQLKEVYSRTSNSYARLNLFRMIYRETFDEVPSVLRKYINETLHIENEMICQLDPNIYDLVPETVIEECDRLVL